MPVDAYYILTSSIAAFTARLCTHPIDTIKTRLQVTQRSISSQTSLERIRDAVFLSRQWTCLQSTRSLYRGLPVTLVFSVPAFSIYLSFYEATKQFLEHHKLAHRHSVLSHLGSGCVAEVMAGLVFTPMEVIKNRLQTERDPHMGQLLRSMISQGVGGFFKGYWMGLAVFVPHTMAYFTTYEMLKQSFGSQDIFAPRSLVFYTLCSSIASVVGITLSTPLDIIKTRWQISAAKEGQAYTKGPIAIAMAMWNKEGGWKAFTRGLGARALWGIPTTAISMTVFERLQDLRQGKHSSAVP